MSRPQSMLAAAIETNAPNADAYYVIMAQLEAALQVRTMSPVGEEDYLVTVQSDMLEWKVSQKQLTEASGFFRIMFTHNFKETSQRKAVLHDDAIQGTELLFAYIIHGYLVPHAEFIDKRPFVLNASEDLILVLSQINVTYQIAIKYDVPVLREHYIKQAELCWPKLVRVIMNSVLAEKLFIEFHVAIAKANGGEEYPRELYGVFKAVNDAFFKYGYDAKELTKMALENKELGRYLLANMARGSVYGSEWCRWAS